MMGPPFKSVHQGLEFAFSNVSGCGSNWPNAASSRGTGSGLSRLDVRAQAGQVQSVVERLKPDEKLWIQLAYGPEPAVSGYAVEMVPYVVGRLPTGAHNVRLVADLVLWSCGRRKDLSLRKMAERYKVSVWKVAKLSARVGEAMQGIGIRAFEALELDFDEHQWLNAE